MGAAIALSVKWVQLLIVAVVGTCSPHGRVGESIKRAFLAPRRLPWWVVVPAPLYQPMAVTVKARRADTRAGVTFSAESSGAAMSAMSGAGGAPA